MELTSFRGVGTQSSWAIIWPGFLSFRLGEPGGSCLPGRSEYPVAAFQACVSTSTSSPHQLEFFWGFFFFDKEWAAWCCLFADATEGGGLKPAPELRRRPPLVALSASVQLCVTRGARSSAAPRSFRMMLLLSKQKKVRGSCVNIQGCSGEARR